MGEQSKILKTFLSPAQFIDICSNGICQNHNNQVIQMFIFEISYDLFSYENLCFKTHNGIKLGFNENYFYNGINHHTKTKKNLFLTSTIISKKM